MNDFIQWPMLGHVRLVTVCSLPLYLLRVFLACGCGSRRHQPFCSSIQKWFQPKTSLGSGSCSSSVPLDSVFYAFAPGPPHIGDVIWTQLPSGPTPLLVWLPRELTQRAAPLFPASLQHMALQAENCPLSTLLVCGVIGNWLS